MKPNLSPDFRIRSHRAATQRHATAREVLRKKVLLARRLDSEPGTGFDGAGAPPPRTGQPGLWMGITVLSVLLTGLVSWAGGSSVGTFENPQPQRDPSNPYLWGAPQYHVWSARVDGNPTASWGSPFYEVDASGYLYADGSGEHRATDDSGLAIQFYTPAEIEEDGVRPLAPGEVLNRTSWMSFSGVTIDLSATGPFVVGNLQYHNDVTLLNSEIESLDLQVSVMNGASVFAFGVWQLGIVSTPNTGTPEQNADFLFFRDYPEFGSFRVLEGETSVIEVRAQFGSLDLQGFGSVTEGGGFWSPSVHVPETSVWTVATSLLLGGWAAARRWWGRA